MLKKKKINIIFLDTQHTAKHVEKIFYMYFNKLEKNGLFIIDDISWLPYVKNAWRDNEWIENNNKDTFLKLVEIYNNNQKNLKISFVFQESGLKIIKKKKNKIKIFKKKIKLIIKEKKIQQKKITNFNGKQYKVPLYKKQ